jgi:glycosyltransferase involved in cell wall biosynthesis
MSPAISLLIRTFNSAGTLGEVLARLDLHPEDELIVVDSGSTDATLAIAEQHHARIVLAAKPFNYSKSLNLGFQAAQNPWVLVISSHCLPLSKDLLGEFRAAIPGLPPTVVVAYGDYSLVESPKRLSENDELAAGCRTNPQAGSLRYRGSAGFQPAGSRSFPAPCSRIVDFQKGSKEASADILFADKASLPAQRQQVYGGNGLALYRRDAWASHPFDETLPTGEDMAWFRKALERGAQAARVPAARALYRNQGSLRHMFRKGWLESRMAIQLAGGRGMNLFQLGINWGSLLKKWGTRKIPFSALLRQGAHALGAYLSPKFSRRQTS